MTRSTHSKRAVGLIAGSLGVAVAMTGLVAGGAFAAPAPVSANTNCAPVDGVTPTTINLAFISSFTGSGAASYVGAYEAAALRIAQENAKGGIFGRKVILTKYDDKSTGDGQIAAIDQAFTRDKNLADINITNQETMFPVLDKAGIPSIGLPIASTGVYRTAFGATGANVPGYTTTNNILRLKKLGATKYATVAFPVPAALVVAKGFNSTLASSGATNVLQINDAPFTAFDATSVALRIKASGADGAYLVLQVPGGLSVMAALKQQGVSLKAPFMAGLSDPTIISATNGGLDGVVGSTYGTVPPGVPGRPGLRTYTNAMLAKGLNPYGPNPPVAYAGADTFMKGLKGAGKCPTREGLINYRRTAKSFDGAGLLPGTVSYRPGVVGQYGDPYKCSWYVSVVNNKMVPDEAATCGQFVQFDTGEVVK